MNRNENTSVDKKYSVVKFLINNSYSEIPTSWLIYSDNKRFCLWPPRTANAASLISNCTSPNLETWKQYEVDFIKYCSTLESARKSAADSNYQTTDEDYVLGRGKRQHILNNCYSSDEEQSDNCAPRSYKTKRKAMTTKKSLSTIPPCPNNLGTSNCFNNNGSMTNVDDAMKNIPSQSTERIPSYTQLEERQFNEILDDMPVILEDYIPLSEEVQEDSYIKESLKQIIRMQASSNLMLQDIKQRVSRLEDVYKSRVPISTKSDSLIAQILPLDTIETIQSFDSLLHNSDEAVMQFKDFLLRIGGNNLREMSIALYQKYLQMSARLIVPGKALDRILKSPIYIL